MTRKIGYNSIMKILFITDLYPVKKEENTTPKTLFNFVKEWQKAGHTVDVIKPNFILNSFLRRKPFYKTDKYGNVINLNYWTPFWFDVKQKCKIQYSKTPSIDTSNYNIVIAHMPSGILFADKLGIPFVAGVHNSDLEVLTNPLYRFHFRKRLEKALYNAKVIACRSYVIKDKLLKLYPEFEGKIFVAPSGIDEEFISSRFNSFSNLEIKVLTCANFIKRKNIDKVIQACKDLKGFELTVIGDGKLEKTLKKLDKNVTFTGRLKPEKVYEKMKESDIFILPSINETFGMVYLEAMAQGCITVCTKNDGIDGIIKDGVNGFLVNPKIDDIKDLLLKIKELDKESLQKIRENSINTVKNLTSDRCAEDYLQQIFKIL